MSGNAVLLKACKPSSKTAVLHETDIKTLSAVALYFASGERWAKLVSLQLRTAACM